MAPPRPCAPSRWRRCSPISPSTSATLGLARGGASRPVGDRRGPRRHGALPRVSARRDRLHLGRHRGGQSGRPRARHGPGRRGRWCARRWSTTPCATPVRPGAVPRCRCTGTGSSTSTRWPARSAPRWGSCRSCSSTTRWARCNPSPMSPPWCESSPPGPCCTPMPSPRWVGSTLAADAAVADLVSVSAHKFGGPKGVGALVRARRGAIWRRCCTGEPRSAAAAPAPTTSPASWAWRRPCAPPPTLDPRPPDAWRASGSPGRRPGGVHRGRGRDRGSAPGRVRR